MEFPTPDFDSLDYTYIHAAVLFADIENSVVLSSTLPPPDYDEMLNAFQAEMLALVERLRGQGMPIGEVQLAGDQLCLFFYDEAEVQRNWQLDRPAGDNGGPVTGAEREALVEECKRSNNNLVYCALRAAIQAKNAWLTQDFNMARVRARREPMGLGIGIHFGRVYLRARPDGRRRIEGYAVNLAKRIEGYSRSGKFSRIMLSQEAHDRIRGTVVLHTQLRQRIFFARHDVALELLKGILESQTIYELKFFSLIGLHVPPEAIGQYEALFFTNRNNVWAYYQLFEHYAYVEPNWERVLQLATSAHLVHPGDEKVLLDLARCHFRASNLRLAREFAQQALALNPDFDLAYEQLALIANERGDTAEEVDSLVKAVALSPGSATNQFNLGLALCQAGDPTGAEHHLLQALTLFPEFVARESSLASLMELRSSGCLPQGIGERLGLSQ